MTPADIELAIEHHRRWVDDFRAALAGQTASLDAQRARDAADENRCALGRWLGTPAAIELLGEDYVLRIQTIHGTFHEIAGEIVIGLVANEPAAVVNGLIDGLADISNSIVAFLHHVARLNRQKSARETP